MLRHVALVAAVTVPIGAMPISASAQICNGVLSWLCGASTSFTEPAPREAQQFQPRQADRSKKNVDLGSACLSREEVTRGYPRYRVINGRHCWYASTRREPKPARIPAKINVNPYDDPIWKESDTTGIALATTRARDCEEQSLKLDFEEKRTFLKQCMSNVR